MRGLLTLGAAVILILVTNCATTHSYQPPSSHSRIIWVEDQVLNVRTQEGSESMPDLYVQISRIDGRKVSGKLIKIDERLVKLSTGYRYESKIDSLQRKETLVTIPKNEILIMQVW